MNLNPSTTYDPGRRLAPQQPGVAPTLTHPFFGFLGALIGMVVAIAGIPSDPRPEGALAFSGMAMSAGLLVSPVLSFLRNRRSIFRVEHLLMFGLIYWILLDLIQVAFPLYAASPQGIVGAFQCIGIFAACFWFANLAPAHPLPRFIINSTRHDLSANLATWIGFVCFGLAMFNYVFAANFDFELIIQALLSNRWYAPWGRGQLGGWAAFRDFLQNFGYILPTITAVVIVRKGLLSANSIFCIVMSIIILAFVFHSGNRRIVGVMVGSAILFWMLSQPHLKIRHFIVGALLVGGLLLLMQIIFVYRHTGIWLAYYQEELSLGKGYINVDDNFLRLAQVVDFFPEQVPYVTYRRLYFTLVRPIPRVFWPDKPLNWGFDLAQALGDVNVSWSTSVLADWYVMYGLITVGLGGFLYGRLASWWSRVIDLGTRPVGLLVYSIGAMAIFCSLRQIDELVLQSYPLIGWFVVSALILKARPPETDR